MTDSALARANAAADLIVDAARAQLAQTSPGVAVPALVGPASGVVARAAGHEDAESHYAHLIIAVLATRLAEQDTRP